ncbi:MAG TPA: adenylate/guanylate cyclase domain-containing protein [Candidatus Acidoferrales bacterium]|nr:adenylate/guanylate cyclase domain-containing protein [Candidatus Acidoferrales bacterium]
MARAKSIHSSFKFSWRTFAFGVVLTCALFALHIRYLAAFERLELIAYDLRLNTITPHPSSGIVAIAAIDDKSIAQIGQWPWPRAELGRLVDALKDYQVKVAAFDAIFSEPDKQDVAREEMGKRLAAMGLKQADIRSVLGASNDDAFATAIKSQGTTILGYAFQGHKFEARRGVAETVGFLRNIRPPAPMTYGIVRQAPGTPHDLIEAEAYAPPVLSLNQAAHAIGYFDIDADADGEIRTEMTVVRFDGHYCVPMFLAAADAYAGDASMVLGVDPNGVSGVSIAGVKIPVADDGRMLVNFRRGADAVHYYSVSDIIDHKVAPENLAGKIVLVGATAHGLGDRGVTPINPDMPRVEIHAHAIDNVIQGDFIRRPIEAVGISVAAAIVLGLAMALGVAWLSALSSAALGVVLAVGYYSYVQQRMMSDGMVIDVVYPLTSMLVVYMILAGYRYIAEGRERRRERAAMGKYLHPDVLSSVLDSPEGLKLGGERRHLAIMFADIVSFTARAERTEPEDLVAMLNTYMTSMTDVVLESKGVVDKLMGDGIMAFWGAPNAIDNPSRAAVECALQMLANLRVLQRDDPRFADLDIGIGIATGDVVVGNFGGENRFDYSVIGDSVNFASRLEGLTRHFKVHLLVSRQTWTEAGAGFIGRELGLVKVKGKQLLVPIVDVAGRENDSVDPLFYRRFDSALKMIRDGAATTAIDDLKQLCAERPDDTPVQLYLEKLSSNSGEAPTEMVFEFDRK